MTSNKKYIKQKELYGTLAAYLLFSGFMVYTWDKVANDYNDLLDEYNKLKRTEGGTTATKWDSKNINKFLYHAEKMVNEGTQRKTLEKLIEKVKGLTGKYKA